MHSRKRYVSFPEHKGFVFRDDRDRDNSHYDDGAQSLISEDEMALDGDGNATTAVTISSQDVAHDADLLVRASVTAPSNEVIAKTVAIPFFRARRYYGIKTPGYFLEVKKQHWFEVIGVAPSGKVMDGEVDVTVKKRDWNCVWEDWGYRGSYRCNQLDREVLRKKVTIANGQASRFDFTPEGGGEYLVVVEGKNKNFSAAAVEMYAWGDGGGSWRSDDSLSFDVIADKREYQAGDTATLLLKTDLSRGTGLVTIERDGVIERRLFELTPQTKHVQVPLVADHAPNVYVSVALVQGRLGEGRRGKPRMRMGVVNLDVVPKQTSLNVAVATDKKDYRPGQSVTATVKVTDEAGNPVAAEVALTAADEGVLSLIAFATPNPVPAFYLPWGLAVSTATQYTYVKDLPGPNVDRPATGGDSAGPGSLRSRFVATAVWKPGLVTNAKGVATTTFTAPDNLTAFRVMAVAADQGHRFGSADRRFTVSKPLQLHRLLPRFLTVGDKLQGGVVVHNETGRAGRATVRVEAGDDVAIAGEASKTVDVSAGGRVPVLFSIDARKSGTTDLRFSVAMAGERDDVQFKLPIHHPSPERVLRVARGSATVKQQLAMELPKSAIPESAQVIVSMDPDGLAGIESGLRDLIQYPYGCLEQTTSRVVPMVAVRQLAESLDLPGLRGEELDKFVTQGLAKIGRHQTSSGGFSLWPGGKPQLYYTAYALWGLYHAQQAGYPVDKARIQDGLRYLRYNTRPDASAPYFSRAGHNGNRAFALYVRAMLGDADGQAAAKLVVESAMPLYGRAFLAQALATSVGRKDPAVRQLVKDLGDVAKQAIANETLIVEPDRKSLSWYMSGAMRTTAIVIDALLALDGQNKNIPTLVANLMTERHKQRYLSTQANLYSLLALSHYAKSRAGKTPGVTVSLAGKQIAKAQLSGKRRVSVVTAPVGGASAPLVIAPRGEVFYNVEVRYRDRPDTLVAESNSLSLTREYLDEAGAPKSTFKVGDIVRIRLTMPLGESKNHLMVSDRLPAGFEALNARLATVGSLGAVGKTRWGSYRELRDERADFSTEYVGRQTYTREYLVRAIAQGRFSVPPSVAELMYQPEQNARTALGHIEIAGK